MWRDNLAGRGVTKVNAKVSRISPVVLITGLLFLTLPLQSASNRITAAVDNHRRAVLAAQVSPRVQTGVDQGRVDSAMALPYVTLVIAPSAAQQAELDRLLAEQQDPASANYHQWLTPEQYADRFGASQADIDKITSWLASQQLTVKSVARGRNAIAFSGTAGQIETAFNTEIHHYVVNGKVHFANSTNPSIPAAFSGVVNAIHGLHDFRMKPKSRALEPRNTLSNGQHQLAPDDLATIYDITALYNNGIDGSGQKIAVAGQTQLPLSDIDSYRQLFGLPTNDPQTMLVPGTQDPGVSKADLGEADLDVELTGAIARKATVLFVYSFNVMDAVQYVIDQNLASTLSLSYGSCELQTSRADANTFNTWANQANAQGITWFAASGDSGATDCAGGTDPNTNNSLSVDLPAGLPGVTGIGGTEFNEAGGSYWNAKNTTTHASALSYIPEMAWNDSAADGVPAATGGGASTYFTKPSWQTGTGVPNDRMRDVPDVSLSGSADHDGYQIVSSGQNQIIGGTSAGPPQFAGITALLNEYLIKNGFQKSAGLGNINPTLYSLATTSGVFHDITTGNNKVVPCEGVHGICNLPAIGYSAGVGYDLTTGLGTVDVYNLVTAWHGGAVSRGSVTVTLAASVGSLAFTDTTVLAATVKSADGGTPTGSVAFSVGSNSLGSATLAAGSGGTATATLNIPGLVLASGKNTITAQYDGDTAYAGGSATATVTITSAATGPPLIKNMANGASFTTAVAPGGILSIFGTNLSPVTTTALSTPLQTMLGGTWVTIDGVTAPLYYVSPTQLNVQIPYEVQADSNATVRVNNNGESVFTNLAVSAIAPAIFTFAGGAPVPFTTAARGDVITLYMTGAGTVSPTVATGAAPSSATSIADLPVPVGTAGLKVGGVSATIDFIGIPTWSVGVVQVNYTIPTNAPLGAQQVIMSIGGVASAATTLTVTQ